MNELTKRKRREWDTMDMFMGTFFNDFNTIFGDLTSTDECGNMVFEIECPGFNKENVNVTVADGILTIHGKRKTQQGYERELFKRYRVGHSESVDATLADGILTLTIGTPKKDNVKIELK